MPFELEWPPVCHNDGITGEGPFKKGGVMGVGIAPGRDEVVSGRPFTGPSGKLLNASLEAVGFPREEIYLTNLVCWRPTWATGTDRDPTPTEIEACFPRLLKEISQLRPRLIITLGTLPTRTLYPEREVGVRGAVLWSNQFDCWILPIYHPAYVLRSEDGDKMDVGHNVAVDFVRDLKKIKNVMSWPADYRGPQTHVCKQGVRLCKETTYHLRVVRSRAEAQWVLDNLKGLVALDFECDSSDDINIDILSDSLLCLAVSDGVRSWVFPGELCRDLIWPDSGRDIRWLAHFGLFDAQVARQQLNWSIYLDEDSLIASNSLDERPGVHGLKQLLREYLGVGFYEEALSPWKKKRMGLVPKELLYEYNAKDSLFTHQLMEKYLIPAQLEDDVREFYQRHMMPALNTFVEIQYHGMFVSEEEIRKLGLEWLPRHIQAEKELSEMAAEVDVFNINVNSSSQLADLLYNRFKLPAPTGVVATNRSGDKSTKKHPTTAQAALKAMEGMHPFVDKLLEYRHLDHMVGTYIIGILDDIKKDGRVHALVKLHGTVTGRLSYTDPPLQTIPDETGVGDDFGRMRQIFTAPNDDYFIANLDYTRAEIYVAAGHSKDPHLLEDLATTDFHRQAAAFIFRVPVEKVTSMQRAYAKRLVFGVMYGLDAKAAAWKFGVSVKEAEEWMNIFFERYDKFRDWCLLQKEKVLSEGEVRTLFGRKRRFPLVINKKMYDKTVRQAINCVIQGDASDATLSTLIECHQELKQFLSYVLLMVHDSNVFEIHKKYAFEALSLIQEIATKPRHSELPSIPIELKIGPSWGRSKPIIVTEEGMFWIDKEKNPIKEVDILNPDWFTQTAAEAA